jgi:hypothetical protein
LSCCWASPAESFSSMSPTGLITIFDCLNTGHNHNNGAVSKVIKNLFLTLHGHNIHCQQQELSELFMYCQQFACHAYCGAAGPASKMASQQETAFCVLRFEVSRSVIIVQSEFRTRFKKDIILVWCGVEVNII